jgi:hypothetical protein
MLIENIDNLRKFVLPPQNTGEGNNNCNHTYQKKSPHLFFCNFQIKGVYQPMNKKLFPGQTRLRSGIYKNRLIQVKKWDPIKSER